MRGAHMSPQPPRFTLEYTGGRVRQEIFKKYFTWPREISTPRVFFGLPKEVGGILRMPDFSLDMSIGYTWLLRTPAPDLWVLLRQWNFWGVASRAVKYHGFVFSSSKMSQAKFGKRKKQENACFSRSAGLHVPDHIHRCPLIHNRQRLDFLLPYFTVYKSPLKFPTL